MGASTGNRASMDAARRQQAMEGQAMRRRVGFGLEATPQPSMGRGPQMGRGPEMRSGINFGLGRANRIPDQGSPEYEQMIQRVRGLGQMRR